MNQRAARLLLKSIALTAALLTPWLTSAQADWPHRPVKIIVNGAPGSPGDMTARLLADGFTKTFKQPFIVDNRPGANGILGTEYAAHQPPDSYTLLLTFTAAQVVNPLIYGNAKYDGVRDFTAIAQLGSGGTLLVVPTSLKAQSLGEFVAYLKSRPANSMSYGSWGVGSGGHLSMEVLLQSAGQHMNHIPYKTMNSAVLDLASGRLDSAFLPMATARPLLDKGQVRAIAISGPYRHRELPEVKTMTEQGVPFELAAWYGLFASGSISKEIANKLNADVRRMLTQPELKDKWPRMGFTEFPLKTADEFADTVRQDARKWAEVVRKAGIKVE